MIAENVKKVLEELPPRIQLIAAAKTRSVKEVLEAVESGIRIVGENYVQEAEDIYDSIVTKAQLHFIGHLQRNKVKKAVGIFDMIQTVDSIKLAKEIDKSCAQVKKIMPILVEVNSGREPQKYGVLPENLESFIMSLSSYSNIKVMGLMTMGPFTGDPELARHYFVATKACFDRIHQMKIPNVEMKTLSMGMTSTYHIAVEEGANMIRIGTKIFGERFYSDNST